MSTHTENAVTPEQTQQEKKGTKIKLVNPLHQFIYRGIAGGIGLASEAIQHRKAKKATANENSGLPAANEAETRDQLVAENELEANWQLDEAQDAICCPEGPPSYQETTQSDAADSSQQNTTEHATQEHPSKLADRFVENHQLPLPGPIAQGGPGSDAAAGTASGYTRGRIELPVLLTQRRPGKRSRGFIRAYAPILQNAGITQDAFMDFVDDLNSAVEPNGLIQALNLASLAGIAIASPAAIALSIGIQLATNIGDEVHSRTKTNSFIDKVNRDFFAPRGLVAAVLTWKPSDTNEFVMSSFDGESAVTSAMDSRQQDTGSKKFKHRFHASAGIAPCEWPETAPLVFPDLDKLVGEDGKKPNVIARSSHFVTEYWDRRARARWAGKNPDSLIAKGAPKESFTSRFSDPNHPASSGDPLALITGGHVEMPSITIPRFGKKKKDLQTGEQPQEGNSNPEASELRRAENPLVPLLSGGLTLLHQDMLYLIIVNRPTDEQIAELQAAVPAPQATEPELA